MTPAGWTGDDTILSAALVERRRLDAECAQVHVALCAVMDLVVDHVEQQRVAGPWKLTECDHRLLESCRRNLWPERFELVRALVPKLQHFLLRPRLPLHPFPVVVDHPAHHRDRHSDDLESELAECAHAADGEAENLIVGEGIDDTARH